MAMCVSSHLTVQVEVSVQERMLSGAGFCVGKELKAGAVGSSGRGGHVACRYQAHLGTGHLNQDLGALFCLKSMSKHHALSRNPTY